MSVLDRVMECLPGTITMLYLRVVGSVAIVVGVLFYAAPRWVFVAAYGHRGASPLGANLMATVGILTLTVGLFALGASPTSLSALLSLLVLHAGTAALEVLYPLGRVEVLNVVATSIAGIWVSGTVCDQVVSHQSDLCSASWQFILGRHS